MFPSIPTQSTSVLAHPHEKNVIEPVVKSSKTSFSFTGIDLFLSGVAWLADGLIPFCQDAGWESEFEQGCNEDVS